MSDNAQFESKVYIGESAFTQPMINIGRNIGNDLVLDGNTVPEFAAILTYKSGEWSIISLDHRASIKANNKPVSKTGCVLDKHNFIDIDCYRLEINFEKTNVDIHTYKYQDSNISSIGESIESNSNLLLNFTGEPGEVVPGNTIEYPFTVVNAGSLVANIQIQVQGIPQDWVQIVPPVINLNEGQRGDFTLVITPPHTSAAVAHPYQLHVAVSSPNYQHQTTSTDTVLTILPFFEYSVDSYTPRTVEINRIHPSGETKFTIHNLSNTNLELDFSTQDDANQAIFETVTEDGNVHGSHAMITIPNGKSSTIGMHIRPHKHPLIGWGHNMFSFNTNVRQITEQIGGQTILGNAIVRPLISIWMVILSLLILTIAVITFCQPRIIEFDCYGDKTRIINAGETIPLKWNVSHFASNVTISYEETNQTLDRKTGSVTISPSKNTVYTLQTENIFSKLLGINHKKTVNVLVLPNQPEIRLFKTDKNNIFPGEDVRWSWALSDNADKMQIVTNKQSKAISAEELSYDGSTPVNEDTLAYIKASNISGTTLRSLYINVKEQKVSLSSFKVYAKPGGSAVPIGKSPAKVVKWSSLKSIIPNSTGSTRNMPARYDNTLVIPDMIPTQSSPSTAPMDIILPPVTQQSSTDNPNVSIYSPAASGQAAQYTVLISECRSDATQPNGYRVINYYPDYALQKGEQVMVEWVVDGVKKVTITPLDNSEKTPAGVDYLAPDKSVNLVLNAGEGEFAKSYSLPLVVAEGQEGDGEGKCELKASETELTRQQDVTLTWNSKGITRLQIVSSAQAEADTKAADAAAGKTDSSSKNKQLQGGVIADYLPATGMMNVNVAQDTTFIIRGYGSGTDPLCNGEVKVKLKDGKSGKLGLTYTLVSVDTINRPTVYIQGDEPNPERAWFIVGETARVTVKLSDWTKGTDPTGSFTITDGLSACKATYPEVSCDLPLKQSGTGITVTASYSGDSNYAPQAKSQVIYVAEKIPTVTTIPCDEIDGKCTNPNMQTKAQSGEKAGKSGSLLYKSSVIVDETYLESFYNMTFTCRNNSGVKKKDDCIAKGGVYFDSNCYVECSEIPTLPSLSGAITVSDDISSCNSTLPSQSCEMSYKSSLFSQPTVAKFSGNDSYQSSTSEYMFVEKPRVVLDIYNFTRSGKAETCSDECPLETGDSVIIEVKLSDWNYSVPNLESGSSEDSAVKISVQNNGSCMASGWITKDDGIYGSCEIKMAQPGDELTVEAAYINTDGYSAYNDIKTVNVSARNPSLSLAITNLSRSGMGEVCTDNCDFNTNDTITLEVKVSNWNYEEPDLSKDIVKVSVQNNNSCNVSGWVTKNDAKVGTCELKLTQPGEDLIVEASYTGTGIYSAGKSIKHINVTTKVPKLNLAITNFTKSGQGEICADKCTFNKYDSVTVEVKVSDWNFEEPDLSKDSVVVAVQNNPSCNVSSWITKDGAKYGTCEVKLSQPGEDLIVEANYTGTGTYTTAKDQKTISVVTKDPYLNLSITNFTKSGQSETCTDNCSFNKNDTVTIEVKVSDWNFDEPDLTKDSVKISVQKNSSCDISGWITKDGGKYGTCDIKLTTPGKDLIVEANYTGTGTYKTAKDQKNITIISKDPYLDLSITNFTRSGKGEICADQCALNTNDSVTIEVKVSDWNFEEPDLSKDIVKISIQNNPTCNVSSWITKDGAKYGTCDIKLTTPGKDLIVEANYTGTGTYTSAKDQKTISVTTKDSYLNLSITNFTRSGQGEICVNNCSFNKYDSVTVEVKVGDWNFEEPDLSKDTVKISVQNNPTCNVSSWITKGGAKYGTCEVKLSQPGDNLIVEATYTGTGTYNTAKDQKTISVVTKNPYLNLSITNFSKKGQSEVCTDNCSFNTNDSVTVEVKVSDWNFEEPNLSKDTVKISVQKNSDCNISGWVTKDGAKYGTCDIKLTTPGKDLIVEATYTGTGTYTTAKDQKNITVISKDPYLDLSITNFTRSGQGEICTDNCSFNKYDSVTVEVKVSDWNFEEPDLSKDTVKISVQNNPTCNVSSWITKDGAKYGTCEVKLSQPGDNLIVEATYTGTGTYTSAKDQKTISIITKNPYLNLSITNFSKKGQSEVCTENCSFNINESVTVEVKVSDWNFDEPDLSKDTVKISVQKNSDCNISGWVTKDGAKYGTCDIKLTTPGKDLIVEATYTGMGTYTTAKDQNNITVISKDPYLDLSITNFTRSGQGEICADNCSFNKHDSVTVEVKVSDWNFEEPDLSKDSIVVAVQNNPSCNVSSWITKDGAKYGTCEVKLSQPGENLIVEATYTGTGTYTTAKDQKTISVVTKDPYLNLSITNFTRTGQGEVCTDNCSFNKNDTVTVEVKVSDWNFDEPDLVKDSVKISVQKNSDCNISGWVTKDGAKFGTCDIKLTTPGKDLIVEAIYTGTGTYTTAKDQKNITIITKDPYLDLSITNFTRSGKTEVCADKCAFNTNDSVTIEVKVSDWNFEEPDMSKDSVAVAIQNNPTCSVSSWVTKDGAKYGTCEVKLSQPGEDLIVEATYTGSGSYTSFKTQKNITVTKKDPSLNLTITNFTRTGQGETCTDLCPFYTKEAITVEVNISDWNFDEPDMTKDSVTISVEDNGTCTISGWITKNEAKVGKCELILEKTGDNLIVEADYTGTGTYTSFKDQKHIIVTEKGPSKTILTLETPVILPKKQENGNAYLKVPFTLQYIETQYSNKTICEKNGGTFKNNQCLIPFAKSNPQMTGTVVIQDEDKKSSCEATLPNLYCEYEYKSVGSVTLKGEYSGDLAYQPANDSMLTVKPRVLFSIDSVASKSTGEEGLNFIKNDTAIVTVTARKWSYGEPGDNVETVKVTADGTNCEFKRWVLNQDGSRTGTCEFPLNKVNHNLEIVGSYNDNYYPAIDAIYAITVKGVPITMDVDYIRYNGKDTTTLIYKKEASFGVKITDWDRTKDKPTGPIHISDGNGSCDITELEFNERKGYLAGSCQITSMDVVGNDIPIEFSYKGNDMYEAENITTYVNVVNENTPILSFVDINNTATRPNETQSPYSQDGVYLFTISLKNQNGDFINNQNVLFSYTINGTTISGGSFNAVSNPSSFNYKIQNFTFYPTDVTGKILLKATLPGDSTYEKTEVEKEIIVGKQFYHILFDNITDEENPQFGDISQTGIIGGRTALVTLKLKSNDQTWIHEPDGKLCLSYQGLPSTCTNLKQIADDYISVFTVKTGTTSKINPLQLYASYNGSEPSLSAEKTLNILPKYDPDISFLSFKNVTTGETSEPYTRNGNYLATVKIGGDQWMSSSPTGTVTLTNIQENKSVNCTQSTSDATVFLCEGSFVTRDGSITMRVDYSGDSIYNSAVANRSYEFTDPLDDLAITKLESQNAGIETDIFIVGDTAKVYIKMGQSYEKDEIPTGSVRVKRGDDSCLVVWDEYQQFAPMTGSCLLKLTTVGDTPDIEAAYIGTDYETNVAVRDIYVSELPSFNLSITKTNLKDGSESGTFTAGETATIHVALSNFPEIYHAPNGNVTISDSTGTYSCDIEIDPVVSETKRTGSCDITFKQDQQPGTISLTAQYHGDDYQPVQTTRDITITNKYSTRVKIDTPVEIVDPVGKSDYHILYLVRVKGQVLNANPTSSYSLQLFTDDQVPFTCTFDSGNTERFTCEDYRLTKSGTMPLTVVYKGDKYYDTSYGTVVLNVKDRAPLDVKVHVITNTAYIEQPVFLASQPYRIIIRPATEVTPMPDGTTCTVEIDGTSYKAYYEPNYNIAQWILEGINTPAEIGTHTIKTSYDGDLYYTTGTTQKESLIIVDPIETELTVTPNRVAGTTTLNPQINVNYKNPSDETGNLPLYGSLKLEAMNNYELIYTTCSVDLSTGTITGSCGSNPTATVSGKSINVSNMVIDPAATTLRATFIPDGYGIGAEYALFKGSTGSAILGKNKPVLTLKLSDSDTDDSRNHLSTRAGNTYAGVFATDTDFYIWPHLSSENSSQPFSGTISIYLNGTLLGVSSNDNPLQHRRQTGSDEEISIKAVYSGDNYYESTETTIKAMIIQPLEITLSGSPVLVNSGIKENDFSIDLNYSDHDPEYAFDLSGILTVKQINSYKDQVWKYNFADKSLTCPSEFSSCTIPTVEDHKIFLKDYVFLSNNILYISYSDDENKLFQDSPRGIILLENASGYFGITSVREYISESDTDIFAHDVTDLYMDFSLHYNTTLAQPDPDKIAIFWEYNNETYPAEFFSCETTSREKEIDFFCEYITVPSLGIGNYILGVSYSENDFNIRSAFRNLSFVERPLPSNHPFNMSDLSNETFYEDDRAEIKLSTNDWHLINKCEPYLVLEDSPTQRITCEKLSTSSSNYAEYDCRAIVLNEPKKWKIRACFEERDDGLLRYCETTTANTLAVGKYDFVLEHDPQVDVLNNVGVSQPFYLLSNNERTQSVRFRFKEKLTAGYPNVDHTIPLKMIDLTGDFFANNQQATYNDATGYWETPLITTEDGDGLHNYYAKYPGDSFYRTVKADGGTLFIRGPLETELYIQDVSRFVKDGQSSININIGFQTPDEQPFLHTKQDGVFKISTESGKTDPCVYDILSGTHTGSSCANATIKMDDRDLLIENLEIKFEGDERIIIEYIPDGKGFGYNDPKYALMKPSSLTYSQPKPSAKVTLKASDTPSGNNNHLDPNMTPEVQTSGVFTTSNGFYAILELSSLLDDKPVTGQQKITETTGSYTNTAAYPGTLFVSGLAAGEHEFKASFSNDTYREHDSESINVYLLDKQITMELTAPVLADLKITDSPDGALIIENFNTAISFDNTLPNKYGFGPLGIMKLTEGNGTVLFSYNFRTRKAETEPANGTYSCSDYQCTLSNLKIQGTTLSLNYTDYDSTLFTWASGQTGSVNYKFHYTPTLKITGLSDKQSNGTNHINITASDSLSGGVFRKDTGIYAFADLYAPDMRTTRPTGQIEYRLWNNPKTSQYQSFSAAIGQACLIPASALSGGEYLIDAKYPGDENYSPVETKSYLKIYVVSAPFVIELKLDSLIVPTGGTHSETQTFDLSYAHFQLDFGESTSGKPARYGFSPKGRVTFSDQNGTIFGVHDFKTGQSSNVLAGVTLECPTSAFSDTCSLRNVTNVKGYLKAEYSDFEYSGDLFTCPTPVKTAAPTYLSSTTEADNNQEIPEPIASSTGNSVSITVSLDPTSGGNQ